MVLTLSKTPKYATTILEQVNNLIFFIFAPILYTYSVEVVESADFSDIYTLYSLRRAENAKVKFQFGGIFAQYVIF